MQTELLKIPEVQKLITVVINPAIQALFAIAVLYFMYGVFKYIQNAEDSTARSEGANHILYGTIGLFIMISVWGIIVIIKSTIGVK